MKNRLLAALAAPAALLLVACGTTDTTKDRSQPQDVESVDCSDDDSATSTGPVSLTDAFGRKIELKAPAERVATLEWQQTEDVLSLCLPPVAVADIDGFKLWDSAEVMPEGVTDVGTRGEPNMEKLFGADPDLVIVSASSADDEIIKQLEKYDVPVLATASANAEDPVGTMLDTFELIAEATGREERAKTVVDEFNDHLAAAKKEVADAKVETSDFVYFDGYLTGGNVSIRPFGQGSLIGELGEELGLTNAWKGKVDPVYGLGTTDIEGMSEVGDAMFFYTGTVDPAGDINAKLKANEVWQEIPAVAEGRSYAFPENVWTFGGPRSSMQVIDAYVDLITE